MIREQLSEFSAIGSDGVKYTIKVFRNRMGAGEMFDNGTPSTDPSSWEYVASVPGINRGHSLIRLIKGSYQILDSDTVITSNDPSAP